MKQINFKQSASQRIYDDYMKRITKAVATLPSADRQDILMEFNSHIYEGFQSSSKESEVDNLLDVLQKLGVPEEILLSLVADRKIEQATKTFNPIHVFKALVLNISNGISYIIFAVLYLALGIGVFLILAKLVNPSEVGLFIGHNNWVFGVSAYPEDEVLGNWFIPFILLAIVALYVLITLLLKLKRMLKK
jgi:uncharacterized membrane protein